jgi:hypothetical protein
MRLQRLEPEAPNTVQGSIVRALQGWHGGVGQHQQSLLATHAVELPKDGLDVDNATVIQHVEATDQLERLVRER